MIMNEQTMVAFPKSQGSVAGYRAKKVLFSLVLGLSVACGRTASDPEATEKDSEVNSAQVLVTGSMMGLAVTVVTEVSKASVSWAWEGLLEKSFGKKKTGDIAKSEAQSLLVMLKSQLDDRKLEEVQIKMNSLQNTLAFDYVPGLPESSTQIAIMADKTNDLLSTFGFWLQSSDPNQISLALAHLGSYAYLTGVKIYLTQERFLAAQKDSSVSKETLKQLEILGPQAAKFGAENLRGAVGPIAETFIRTHKLAYSYQENFEREDFEVRKGIQYQYCAQAMVEGSTTKSLETKICSPKSSLKCPHDLDEACLAKAKEESKAFFYQNNLDKPLVEAIKEIFSTPETDQVIKVLEMIASRSK